MGNRVCNLDEVIERTAAPTLKFEGEMMQSIFEDGGLWPSSVLNSPEDSPEMRNPACVSIPVDSIRGR